MAANIQDCVTTLATKTGVTSLPDIGSIRALVVAKGGPSYNDLGSLWTWIDAYVPPPPPGGGGGDQGGGGGGGSGGGL